MSKLGPELFVFLQDLEKNGRADPGQKKPGGRNDATPGEC